MDSLISLRNTYPFSLLDETHQQELAECSTRRKYSAKELIFLEGESDGAGYLLVSGRVAMLKQSPAGKDLIVELIAPNEIFGIIAVLRNQPYPLTARAQIDSEAICLSQSVLKQLLAKVPQLSINFMNVISERLVRSQKLASQLAHSRVENRVAAALLALLPQFSEKDSSGTISLVVSRQELADLTGINLETASRVMKHFHELGIVDISNMKHTRILKPKMLEEYIT